MPSPIDGLYHLNAIASDLQRNLDFARAAICKADESFERALMRNESPSVANQEGSMAQLLASAERELSAFVTAVNQMSDAEQGRRAARSWIEELERMDWPSGAPVIDWRKVTIAAAARLVRRGKGHVS